MKTPTCNRCGRPLKDPVSIAIGLGPECRGQKIRSHRQVKHRNDIQRGRAYQDKTPIRINSAYVYTHTPDGWTNDGLRYISDERMRAWLMENHLMIPTDDYHQSLLSRRDLMIKTIDSGALNPEQEQEVRSELIELQGVIDELDEEGVAI